jgi:hypothetical protein
MKKPKVARKAKPKRGRPAKPDGRGDAAYVLGIRLTPDERKAWEIARGVVPLSEFVRTMVNRQLTLTGPTAAVRVLHGQDPE